MKKLLVVMLVLAMADMASAEAIMDLDISVSERYGEYNINVVTDPIDGEIGMGEYYIGILTDSPGDAFFDLTNLVDEIGGNLDNWRLSSEYSTDLGVRDNYITLDLIDIAVWPAVPIDFVGTLFTGLKLRGVVAGDVTIRVFAPDISTAGDYVVYVPEPITIGLLGLGGLFLRRRK